MSDAKPEHPAKFSASILEVLNDVVMREAERIEARLRVLDPMAGVGRIHELDALSVFDTVGVELESEWATQHPRTVVGDATALRFADCTFDAVVTSPCLEQSHKVLMADLRWKAVGDVRIGERVIAFDEMGTRNILGHWNRRKWRIATVVRSLPERVRCLRVEMASGVRIVCTPEHPWLVARARTSAVWRSAAQLRTDYQPDSVLKQTETWSDALSYEAGWVAGMFDGEGSLAFGTHGAPKLSMSQAEGPTSDLIGQRLTKLGFQWSVIPRHNTTGKPMLNFYVTGGFPEILRALGMLRPERLLAKLDHLDVASRTIQPWRDEVVNVESVGLRDIQLLETTSGTYLGEGYLMHNCYGNRMADHHNAKDDSKRLTYKHRLGRDLSENSGAGLQWGDEYRKLHIKILSEMIRVTKPGGLVVINISNHIRKQVEEPVSEWWLGSMLLKGLTFERAIPVSTPRMRFGENSEVRVENEWVFVCRKAAA